MRRSILVAAGMAIAMIGPPSGNAEKKRVPPATMPVAELQKTAGTVIPSPGDMLAAVDKLGDVAWARVLRAGARTDYANDQLRALNLGVRCADGFLAIQAKDGKKLGEIIQGVVTLARDLGVSDPILKRGGDIRALAVEEKWKELRGQLDSLRDGVEKHIRDLGEDESATLASMAGWVEALRAVSSVLLEDYTPAHSTILHQPDLVRYYREKLEKLDGKTRALPAVAELIKQAPAIEKCVSGDQAAPIPKETIAELQRISAALVDTIEKGVAQ